MAELARRAGLDAVEWGGDIHVPPGNAQAARAALHCTRENGLTVSAYGSYYRAGAEEDFGPVLETALSLGCRVIRVWAGRQGSALCTQEERRAVTACLARAAERAAQAGCVVATEYHADTLTDTLASALALLGEAPGLRTLWQRWKAEWKICTFIIGTEKAPAALWRREQLTGTPILPRPKRMAHSGMPRWSS